MRDLFPGFYQRTEEEISKLWQEGIFVFDTNMLLNVYRYTEKTRERYFEILHRLKMQNQLWIPYQVAYEYQDRRMDVIQGQLDAYTEVSNILQNTVQKLENSLGPYKKKHGFIDASKMIEEIGETIKHAKSSVTESKEEHKKTHEAIKKEDKLQVGFEELFQGNIGEPYNRSKLEDAYRQAQLRIELKIPPGWEDEDKKSFKMYGDIILWFQLLEYARSQKKSIIFVTDDGKKDWWLPEGKSRGLKRPLPELVQEIHIEAGVLLHMYEGYEFLKEAESFLNLEKQPAVIDEAKEVTQQNTIELNQPRWKRIPDRSLEDQADFAVLEWLETQFPESEITKLMRSNFWMKKPDGEITDVVVNLSYNFISPVQIKELIISLFRGRRGVPTDKQILVLVFLDSDLADIVATKALANLVVPVNITLVIGYLTEEVRFSVISILS